MNKNRGAIINREKRVAELLQKFGFAATIEVSNSINGSYGEKAKQAKRARQHLQALGKHCDISTAVASFYFNDNIQQPRGINFQIELLGYDNSRLTDVLRQVSVNPLLSDEEYSLIEAIQCNSNMNSYELSDYLVPNGWAIMDCSKQLGLSKWEYIDAVQRIKGIALELYMLSLIQEQFDAKGIESQVFHRYRFTYRKVRSDSDVLVFSNKGAFHAAMESLNYDDKVVVTEFTRKS